MYAVDVFEKNREKYEKRIIRVAEENDVFSTEFGEEDGLLWYRAWCNVLVATLDG